MLKDFCDGCASKSHSLFAVHKNALQVLLYFDDIEVVNNLGSHKKVHKLGKWHTTLILLCYGVQQYMYVLMYSHILRMYATCRCVLLHPGQP